MKMCVKLRSKMFGNCIGRHGFIFRNFDVCLMVVKSRNKDVPKFVLVGVNHKLTRSTKVYVDGEEVEYRWGWDSRVMQFPSNPAVGRLRRVCVMLNVAGVG